VRQQQISLNLADFVSVDHLVEFLVVAVVHFLEHVQHLIDVLAVGVVGRRHALDLLHDQDIFGKSLNGLDKVVPESEQVVFGVDPNALDEFLKVGVMLHEVVDLVLAQLIVIEILEVYLEEMNLLLHLLEDNLVVRVIVHQLENSRKKQFVQPTYLVDVRKYYLCLLFVYDPFAQHTHFEVGNHHTQIANVSFFRVHHLLYYQTARSRIFY
jgi:hypothetical protein